MTPEQKIIAIAEFEGWTELRDGRWKLAETGIVERFLPPYLTYRDAICGAVARLDDVGRMKFVWHLSDIFCGYEPELVEEKDMPALEGSRLPLDYVANMILATPAQLADALLLTLGYEI